ncbi:MAG: amidase family protein [Burkholderiaceae bacterium]
MTAASRSSCSTDIGSITDLAGALQRHELSALDACEQAIERINRLDSALNAVPTTLRDFDRARQQARNADAAMAKGDKRPLLGVPILVKESFDVAGLPTCWGLPFARDRRANADAVAVERLKRAGAVLLGKTNVPTALADWQCDNPVYGRTVHPMSSRHTPGGSSGGSAVALAAGYVPLALGSDFAGSLRVPAHFCGVLAHKPTHGLVPLDGHAFPTQAINEPDPFTVVGPMARSADDLMLALELLAGPAGTRAAAWRVRVPPSRCVTLKDCRVLVLDRHPATSTDAAVRTAVRDAADALADAGAQVIDRHPALPSLTAGAELHTALHRALLSRLSLPGSPPPIPVTQWFGLLDQKATIQAQWETLFRDVDVVITPPFGTPAFEHQVEPDLLRRTLPIDGEATPYVAQIVWPGLATLASLPATVVPWRPASDGMPTGLQIIGPAWEDRTPITVAGLIERIR